MDSYIYCKKCKVTNFALIFIVFLLSHAASAQVEGYIIIGDTTHQDGYLSGHVKGISPTHILFYKHIGDKAKAYTPSQISSFAFNTGEKYVAAKVQLGGKERHLFLRFFQLASLQVLLVEENNKPQFYLKEKEHLVPIEKDKLWAKIQQNNSCKKDHSHDFAGNLYTKHLVWIEKNLQNDRCRYVPKSAYGITVSTSSRQLILANTDTYNYPENKDYIDQDLANIRLFSRYHSTNSAIGMGFFADLPFWTQKNTTSALLSGYFSKYRFKGQYTDNKQDWKLNSSYLIINATGAFKYTFNTYRFQPFAELGAGFQYLLNGKSTIHVLNYSDTGEVNSFTIDDKVDFPHFQPLISSAIGIQWRYSIKRYAALSILKDIHLSNSNYKPLAVGVQLRLGI